MITFEKHQCITKHFVVADVKVSNSAKIFADILRRISFTMSEVL